MIGQVYTHRISLERKRERERGRVKVAKTGWDKCIIVFVWFTLTLNKQSRTNRAHSAEKSITEKEKIQF